MPSDESNDDRARLPAGIRIAIDAGKCIAAGHCVGAAPDIFDQNEDDGVVILRNERPSVSRLEAVKAAAHLCPTSAIEVIEEWHG